MCEQWETSLCIWKLRWRYNVIQRSGRSTYIKARFLRLKRPHRHHKLPTEAFTSKPTSAALTTRIMPFRVLFVLTSASKNLRGTQTVRNPAATSFYVTLLTHTCAIYRAGTSLRLLILTTSLRPTPRSTLLLPRVPTHPLMKVASRYANVPPPPPLLRKKNLQLLKEFLSIAFHRRTIRQVPRRPCHQGQTRFCQEAHRSQRQRLRCYLLRRWTRSRLGPCL